MHNVEGVKHDDGKLRHDFANPGVINAITWFYMHKTAVNFAMILVAFVRPAPRLEDSFMSAPSVAPRPDLIPEEGKHELALVYGIGAGKYGDRNWERGMAWGRIVAAIIRHLLAWMCGQKRDPVDGQHHLASVAWGAMALITYEARGVGSDFRLSP